MVAVSLPAPCWMLPLTVPPLHEEIVVVAALVHLAIDIGASAVGDPVAARIQENGRALDGAVVIDGGIGGAGNRDALVDKGAGLIEDIHAAVAVYGNTRVQRAPVDDTVVAIARESEKGIDIAAGDVGHRVIAITDDFQAAVDIAAVDKSDGAVVFKGDTLQVAAVVDIQCAYRRRTEGPVEIGALENIYRQAAQAADRITRRVAGTGYRVPGRRWRGLAVGPHPGGKSRRNGKQGRNKIGRVAAATGGSLSLAFHCVDASISVGDGCYQAPQLPKNTNSLDGTSGLIDIAKKEGDAGQYLRLPIENTGEN